jgi:hypothetical protein
MPFRRKFPETKKPHYDHELAKDRQNREYYQI